MKDLDPLGLTIENILVKLHTLEIRMHILNLRLQHHTC